MTVMFCDMKGFTGAERRHDAAGLVKIMNRYLSTMSGPIHEHRGMIDKYIGDGIMAYWGPPFIEQGGSGPVRLHRGKRHDRPPGELRKELPELLGVRTMMMECDLRIGVATGEALVGSMVRNT